MSQATQGRRTSQLLRSTTKAVARDVHVPWLSNGCVLHPACTFRLSWDMLMTLFIVYTVIEVPFRIGFAQVRLVRRREGGVFT